MRNELTVAEVERSLDNIFGVSMSLHGGWVPGVLNIPNTCPFCRNGFFSGALSDTVEMGVWVKQCPECGVLVSRVLDTLTF